MQSMFEYVVTLLLLLLVWAGYALRKVNWKEYFSTRTGLGILKGIVIAVSFSLVLAGVGLLAGCTAPTGTYFNEASVYAGLDLTKAQSPQCKSNEIDERTTSNLGVKLNIYTSEDGRFKANSKVTHHSCAFGEDRNTYDALGGELEYKFWAR